MARQLVVPVRQTEVRRTVGNSFATRRVRMSRSALFCYPASMKRRRHFPLATAILFALAGLLLVAGCAKSSQNSSPQAAPPRKPTNFTPDDLARLHWIEGTWRGTGDIDKPFYERYRFEGTTALLVDSFDDEKVDKVTDTTRFELKDGQLSGGDRKSTRLNSSHRSLSRMPSSA